MEEKPNQAKVKFSGKREIYTVFIGCLPGKTTTRDLIKKYKKRGKIFNINLKKKFGKGSSSGYGSFRTSSRSLFKYLITTPQTIHGRRITCRKFLEGKEKIEYLESLNQRRIFITGLDSNWTDEEIFGFFSQNWEIEKAYAIRKSKNVNRGFGYVNFYRVEDVQEVLKMNYLRFNGVNVECRIFKKFGKSFKKNNSIENFGRENYENLNIPRFLKKDDEEKKLKLPNLDFSEKDKSIVNAIARSGRIRRQIKKKHRLTNLRFNQSETNMSSTEGF